MNGGNRDGRFGLTPIADYTARANAETFVGVQIETAGALASLREIAAIPDVDLLFVGPSDLSQVLGVTGEFDHPKCMNAIETIARASPTPKNRGESSVADPNMSPECKAGDANYSSWPPTSMSCTRAFGQSRNVTPHSSRAVDNAGLASDLPLESRLRATWHSRRNHRRDGAASCRLKSLLRFCSIAESAPIVTRR